MNGSTIVPNYFGVLATKPLQRRNTSDTNGNDFFIGTKKRRTI
jgi:hypothetical protein